MMSRLPATGRNYEVLILRRGQQVTIFEPEKVNERTIQKVCDRKPLTRGGRIVRRPQIQGWELNFEGGRVDPVVSILLTLEEGLNLKGEFVDPTGISVHIRISHPQSALVEENIYTECVLTENERNADDLDAPIMERFKITAVYRNGEVISEPRPGASSSFNFFGLPAI